MHPKNLIFRGKPIEEAKKALIVLHGRGSTAEDIVRLASHFDIDDFAVVAPEAYNNSWYPLSFLAPSDQNEPWLSSALELMKEIEADLNEKGFASENIFFLGFSQGACLTLEYMTRNAKKYGGGVALIGGLIGEKINTGDYLTNFEGTPIFLGTSDPDPHVPLERVEQTKEILENKNAKVVLEVFENAGHTVVPQEVELANRFIFEGGKSPFFG